MQVTDLEISAVKLLRPRRISDPRGYFVEIWNRKALAEAGIDIDFVQDNASFSERRGRFEDSTTSELRRHRQSSSASRAALLSTSRSISGARRRASAATSRRASPRKAASSSSFRSDLRTVSVRLSRIRRLPTRSRSSIRAEHDAGILWNDPELGIDWPLAGRDAHPVGAGSRTCRGWRTPAPEF